MQWLKQICSNHCAVCTCCCWGMGNYCTSVAVVALDQLEVGVAEASSFLAAEASPLMWIIRLFMTGGCDAVHLAAALADAASCPLHFHYWCHFLHACSFCCTGGENPFVGLNFLLSLDQIQGGMLLFFHECVFAKEWFSLLHALQVKKWHYDVISYTVTSRNVFS